MSATAHSPSHHHLHVPGRSVVHRMAPEAKLAALVVFVAAVALTPRRAVAAFAVDAVAVVVVAAVAGLRVGTVLRRLAVIVPFLLVAVLIPFIAEGDRVQVLWFSVSGDGVWAAWNIVAKALLGATAAIIVSATTALSEVLRGLSRLRVPPVLVSIIAFMFRYLDVVADQLHRMRSAMVARCHDPRWLWQARPIASAAGALFVRSYERGERIHQAMLARGFTGAMPSLSDRRATPREWVLAMAVPSAAVLSLVGAVVWS